MSEQPSKKPFNHRKYPNTKTKCIGCGFMNTWTDRQPVCIYHTPENLAKLQKKLNSPVVEFVSKKSNGRSQGACELVTLMEMIVIPELEPEELPPKFPSGVDIFAQDAKTKEEISKYISANKNVEFPLIDRPRFSPPSATFPEVVNLTLDFANEALQELGGRLSEYFIDKTGKGFGTLWNIRPEFARTCRFDLQSRFPNLTLLTLVEHDGITSGLTNLFLLPSSLRVLRTNKNVLHPKLYSDFFSNVPILSDVLIDFKVLDKLLANEEVSIKEGSAPNVITELSPSEIDMSIIPRLRRVRFTNVIIRETKKVSGYILVVNKVSKLCEFLKSSHAPPGLESLEFPMTFTDFNSNMIGSILFFKEDEKLQELTSPYERVLDNFICEFPKNITSIDVSCPPFHSANSTNELDRQAQHQSIIIIIYAFEQCYFEDIYNKMRLLFSKASSESSASHKKTPVNTIENLKRNLRLFLGGSQFGLPTSFADNVIREIEERYREVRSGLSNVTFFSRGALDTKTPASHSKKVSYYNQVKIERDKLQDMMSNSLKQSLNQKLRAAYQVIGVDSKAHHVSFSKQKLPVNASLCDRCGCEVCKIAIRAGIKEQRDEAVHPFSISDIGSMAEYDAIFFPKHRSKPDSRSPRHSRSPRRRRSRARSPDIGRVCSSPLPFCSNRLSHTPRRNRSRARSPVIHRVIPRRSPVIDRSPDHSPRHSHTPRRNRSRARGPVIHRLIPANDLFIDRSSPHSPRHSHTPRRTRSRARSPPIDRNLPDSNNKLIHHTPKRTRSRARSPVIHRFRSARSPIIDPNPNPSPSRSHIPKKTGGSKQRSTVSRKYFRRIRANKTRKTNE